MTSEHLNTVNDYHPRNIQYIDTISATNILNRTNKQAIAPQAIQFNKSFEYGDSAE